MQFMTAVTSTIPAKRAAVPPLLAVRDLAVHYGPLRALTGVSLSIREGEVVALAGENGAGKTTLVRCIGGDIARSGGEILIEGAPLSADPAAIGRQGVSVLWQDLALCDNLDIAANLMLGRERRLHVASEVRLHTEAARLLAELGISLPATTRDVRSLSGGQRQLVAVARAIARRPKLLLLDEPTAALGVAMSRQVEDLINELRAQQTSVLLACHDIDMMFRLADRIVVLRHGQVVAEVAPAEVHPDDVLALQSGQNADSSARSQLTRLHGLTDRLVSADPSSSLSMILSALGAALGSERLCIHLVAGDDLACAASLGLSQPLLSAWSRLPVGPAGGPAGLVAASGQPVIEEDVRFAASWAAFAALARSAKVASSWSVPVPGPSGLMAVITVFRAIPGRPTRDDLDLVTLYAGYAASAIERDHLLDEVTARNRVLETIREMLETLAGPLLVSDSMEVALGALCRGLQADAVVLATQPPDTDGQPGVRASAAAPGGPPGGGPAGDPWLIAAARRLLGDGRADDTATRSAGRDGSRLLSVTFAAPGCGAALIARWSTGAQPADATALLEDAARSLRLALEREEASIAHQEALTLRRARELQREFLSRLSHELRTPLTAIRGYASSLMQPDVTWDGASQRRFLGRIAAESARLGRLVDDLLDFSAIESGILRLQQDWCDLPLVLEAAIACLPPDASPRVRLSCAPGLPVIWADHDRLEQVFVNLLANALGHNPAGTSVRVFAAGSGPAHVAVTVADDGVGLSPDLAVAPFEAPRRRRGPTAGAGLGLSIARGIVLAHGGEIELVPQASGTCFRICLPVEAGARNGQQAGEAGRPGPAGGRALAEQTGVS
jgi:signal transduction histidine kinase/ABC-type branched-subunit amino acid transport system ATPase component/DNA-binding transcriptional regulator YdaS (Cro superfamily)